MAKTRREEILDAALEMFAERGYRGTSLDAIAERVGLTRQGVLHYFPSKKRLLMAIIKLREELAREHLGDERVQEDWPKMMAESIAFDHEYPRLARVQTVLLAESITEGHPAQEYYREYYQATRESTVRLLTERYGERLPSGLDTRAAAIALLAMLDGLQQQWLLDREQNDHPEIMRDVLTVLLGSTPR
jgi:AcrR family transcriptional regulator